jgi:hypothetical protein
MEQRYEAEELDQDTLDYLRTAAERQGHGMPGIYFDTKQAKLWGPTLYVIAALSGLLVIVLTFFLTWGSLADPINTAMMQTAGFLLGGWLFVAWIRSLIAQQRADYVGYFKYVDPLYIWTGLGRAVLARPIGMLVGASQEHNYDTNGNYSNTVVKVALADGREAVTVGSMSRGERLQEYLNALAEQRDGTPAERGYAALSQVETEDDEDDYDDDERAVKEIPLPKREGGSAMSLLPLILLPVIALLLFFGCKWLAAEQRDDAYFDEVKGKGVNELRSYMIDRRNTRHREAVKKLLEFQAEQSIARVKTQGDPVLRAGLAELVRAVAGETRPVITLHVVKQPKRENTPEQYLSPAVQETLNRQIINEISKQLGQHVGQQTADYGEVTEPSGMIEFTPKVELPPRGERGGELRIVWTVTLQATPEAKKHTLTLNTSTRLPHNNDDPVPAVRSAYGLVANAFNQRLSAVSPPQK